MSEDDGALTPAQRKLFELRMKVNAGRKANKQVRESVCALFSMVNGALTTWTPSQEVAAEHERVVNKDAQARKTAAVKRKQVRGHWSGVLRQMQRRRR